MRRLGFFLLAGLLLLGCRSSKTDWSISLDADGKTPYGAKLVAEGLPGWFREAHTERLPSGFRYNDLYTKLTPHTDGRTLLLLFGLDFFVSEREWSALQEWVAAGNEVVVFASGWDSQVLSTLGLQKAYTFPDEEQALDSVSAQALRTQAVWLTTAPTLRYTHRGRSLLGSFERDTVSMPDTLEQDYVIGPPSVIGSSSAGITALRYPIGQGWMTLHTAPLVLSNYFLLQANNRRYLEDFWQAAAPSPFGAVYWQDYYKRSGKEASLSSLWRYPAVRWALCIALLTVLLYAWSEGKRRQRIIPIVRPPENTSVLFAETVGRLYYSEGNHRNLAEKMVQQVLEVLRTQYLLPTEVLDNDLALRLAGKAALPEEEARDIIRRCYAVRSGLNDSFTETELSQLHQALRPLLR